MNRAQVLIIGMPGRMQEGLRTLLNAIPQFDVKDSRCENWPPTELLAGDVPDLVLLDFGLPAQEAIQDLEWIKSNWTSTRCLVLANTVRQQIAAKAAGADGVLLRGFSGAEFFAAIRALLVGKVTGLELRDPKAPEGSLKPELPEPRASFSDDRLVKSHSFVF